MGGVLEHLLLFVFPFAMAFAAATDLLTMKIPNALTLGLAAAFLVAAPVAGLAWPELLSHLGAGALLLILGIILFSLGWVGGGDAKLLAAAALWLGFDPLLPFLSLVTVFGGALAIVLLAYRSVPATALPLPDWAARLHAKGGAMPYGVAIAAGALTIYPSTAWYGALAG
jgi:prepilin peptidase CpaA